MEAITTPQAAAPAKKTEKDWLESPAVEGLPAFVRVPTAFLLDPKVGPRERLVFMCLASHANKAGKCEPSLDRIAEMCGFYSQGKPDRALLSKLTKSLEQRGWLVKLGQKGFNRVQMYQLQVSPVALGELRSVTDRQVADAEYKENKAKNVEPDFKAMGFKDVDDFLDYQNDEGRFKGRERVVQQPKPAPAKQQRLMKEVKHWKEEAETEDWRNTTAEKLATEVADYHDGLVELQDLPPQHVFVKFNMRRPTHRLGF